MLNNDSLFFSEFETRYQNNWVFIWYSGSKQIILTLIVMLFSRIVFELVWIIFSMTMTSIHILIEIFLYIIVTKLTSWKMKNSLRLKETDSTKHSKLLLLIIFPLLCYKFMFGFSIISIEISTKINKLTNFIFFKRNDKGWNFFIRVWVHVYSP